MRFGAHCVLYGAEIAADPEAVLGRLARAGAKGCEIGQRFFGTDNRERLLAALAQNHVELSGMHCNGLNLTDLLQNPKASEEALITTARFVAPMENKNVIATGCVEMEKIKDRPIGMGVPDEALHNPEQVRQMAVTLNKIVKRIREEYGVQIHYHNHSWEFADQGMIWNALVQHAPDLMFALDTGWAAVSGFDPVKLLRSYPDRFQYVHLRDYKKSELAGEKLFSQVHSGYVDLGTGDMDYHILLPALNEVLGENDWAIVEYELGNFDETSYTGALNYLREIYALMDGGTSR